MVLRHQARLRDDAKGPLQLSIGRYKKSPNLTERLPWIPFNRNFQAAD